MDGFVRYNKYSLDGKKMKFSSKVIDDTQYWAASQKHKEPQMALFEYPTPKRTADRVPGISMQWCSGSLDSEGRGNKNQCDNIGIQPWLMPDGKTAVFTTDSPNFLLFDVADLSTKGWLSWNEKDFDSAPTGATHVVDDITTGDLLGLITEMETGIKSKYFMTFYRIKGEDIHTKVKIGTIPLGSDMPYYHSFGHTADQLIFQHNSIDFDVTGMMMGKPMEANFKFMWDRNLEFYVMNMTDGTSEVFPCDHPGYILHTGNNFIDKDGLLVTEAEMYVRAETDPFQIMDRAWLLNPDRDAHHVGARLRRYYLNLQTKEVTYKDLLVRDTDTIGFVLYNPRFAGQENQYTYVCSLDYQEHITRLHRFDAKNDFKDLIWEEQDVYISEPAIVVNPKKKGELDMVLMFSVYDHKIKANRFIIIDPKTMKTISDTTMDFRMPMTLH